MPEPVEDFDWFVSVDQDEADLEYVLDESDILTLRLLCETGSGMLDVYAVDYREEPAAEPGDEREIILEAGGRTARLRGIKLPLGEVVDGGELFATAPLNAPVFVQFRKLGWIARRVGDVSHPYAPHPGSEKNIETFFAACD